MAADQPHARDYKETLFLPQTDFPMKAGLPKKEPEILARWKAQDLYGQLRKDGAPRPKFVLHDGPPYANGHLHLGHALNNILKDLVVRSHQMMGFDSDYIPGWDCHGLPIEWKVEEQFRAAGRKKDEVPASEFRAACRAYAEEWVNTQRVERIRVGGVGDWDHPYTTMAFEAEAAIVAEFLKVAMSGQLYRGSKPVMWSPVERTSLAEAEVEYNEKQSHTIWVKFPVSGADYSVVIWTTTPWTIPGNRAISFSPSISYGVYEVEALEADLKFEPWAKPGDKFVLADKLAEDVFKAAKVAKWKRVADFKGDGLKAAHPLRGKGYEFDVPLLAGDHVTDDAGTGFVHTAPGHGVDDFNIWIAKGFGLKDIPFTVDEDGRFTDQAPGFTGLEILQLEGKNLGKDGPANEAVIAALIEAGNLLARGRIKHSYPHSWRSKAPVIFRNTPQWFVTLGDTGDAKTLRAKALKAIDDTEFYPPQGRNRLRAMVEERPDWLVSRQRAWGVPLTLFVDKDGKILNTSAANERIVAAVTKHGADVWWTEDAKTFVGNEFDASSCEKVTDILDVWFDSGATHAFVLGAPGALKRPSLAWPADVYLEGSDQHRGWFQSSLLEGCATIGRAPFKKVVTHGFLLDEQGRKQSKSLGNTVDPLEVADKSGMEILRVWVATSDYMNDLALGKNILEANSETYRKLRNTLRYMLGALSGFTDAERVAVKDMPLLERAIVHRVAELDQNVRKNYTTFEYARMMSELVNFCVVDLSAFYFDVRKDSLYCDRGDELRRRACRTVLDILFERLTAWLAPIMVFTTEEAWLSRNGEDAKSVHLRQFPETPADWLDAKAAERMEKLRAIRRVVTGALEIERAAKRVGSSLEAAPEVWISDAGLLQAVEGESLADLCIVSAVDLKSGEGPADAFRVPDVSGVAVVFRRAEGRKCARSWKYFDPTTADPRHPDLTPRDADAVAWWDAQQGRTG